MSIGVMLGDEGRNKLIWVEIVGTVEDVAEQEQEHYG